MDIKTAKQLEAKIAKAEKAVSVAIAVKYLAYDFSLDRTCLSSDSDKPVFSCWCAECHELVASLLNSLANVLDETHDLQRLPAFRGVKPSHLREHAETILPSKGE